MQPAAAAAPSALPSSVFPKDPRPLPCLLLASLLLLLLLHLLSSPAALPPPPPPRLAPLPITAAAVASAGPAPPALAFLLAGSAGDADRLLRLLLATYHPRNTYLLLLDRAASDADRARLARNARAAPGRDNVHVVGDPGFANPRGSSALAATLHGAALLLRVGHGWDWFVHLDAADYPLVTPDDLLHVLSYLPKDLNFIQHSSYIGWKEARQIRPIIVDPGLYLSSRNDIFYATQKRDLPNAYKLFTVAMVVIEINRHVIGIDIDPQSLELAQENSADLELDIDLVWSDIKNLNLKGFLVDTVVMNPPFGTRKKGADMEFLSMGLKVASQAVYSLHKTSTREHIKKAALRDFGAVSAEVLCELRYDLPQSYKFHKKREVDIAVDLWRFVPNARRSS